MPMRPAQLHAAGLNVCCPYCGEAQPAPNGSDIWLMSEVKQAATSPRRDCVSCDKSMLIFAGNSARVDY